MRQKPIERVTLTMALSGSPAEVWKAWTCASQMGWFGSDPAGTVVEARAAARRGGRFVVTFENSDGSRYACFRTYLVVEPPRRLEFTWVWAGHEEHTELVRVSLTGTETGTAMLFEHLDIDPATSHNYVEGWRTCFEKLERSLKKEPSRY